MNEEKFWEIVANINWGKLVADRKSKKLRGVDTGRVKVAIMRKYSQEVMNEFNEIKVKKTCHLYKVINAYNDANGAGIPSGGDSGDDLINHAVGLGKEYFNQAIADPSILTKLDYEESFAYCIPFNDDYDSLQPGFFKDGRVRNFREEALQTLAGSKFAPIYADELKFLTGVVEALEADAFASLPEPAIVRGYWNAIREKVNKAEGTLKDLRELDEYLSHHEWFLSNIVSDARNLAL